MKKFLSLLMVAGILFVSGCEKVSDLLVPEENEDGTIVTETIKPIITPEPEEEPQTKIPISQMIQMTNDWELLGDYNFEITKKGKKDRIVLGTSAQAKNGEFMWDDSQYWTVAVISEDGAYNLFSQRMQGQGWAPSGQVTAQGRPEKGADPGPGKRFGLVASGLLVH